MLQQKLIRYALILGMIPLLLFTLILMPAKGKKDEMKKNLTDIESYLMPFKHLLNDTSSLQEALQSFTKRSQEFERKFPAKEEEAIKLLSVYAQQTNIKITSLKMHSKEPFQGGGGNETKIDGKVCLEVPVTMELAGSYNNLIEYLKILRESLPSFLVVEEIKINRGNAEQRLLNISLSINLYLLA